ncbi:SusC/RagA family TonB-linked outer membrane protein [Pontibacter harenae]|uniref:SusC/RagA family TonB-linked outer membrane protein n=1 Tax=Pontibacter harenae TaxID=2894083 RepID=UPI001E38F911|nr:SusC/RagA family TonB-linked outer membrane protein [Pontibacter harenae]MCC9168684.1 SusC/RagA family TonB-linked outer membrane protein [Pontibacter harenae]
MRKILLMSFLMVLVLLQEAMAQSRTITGTVTDQATGTGLPGVSVILEGTTTGTATGVDGGYSINVPAEGGTLLFRYIGYNDVRRTIGAENTINVTLSTNTEQLQEVVVTALGIERNRNELAYSAQEVSGDQVTRTRSTDVVNTLSGKVAGLDIRSNNTLGGSTNVIIRGYSSITGNNQPLFVIDGVPVSNANTNTATQQAGGTGIDFGNAAGDLNPDNIESVNVLKGAAATALYGSRAANGVIMITTKRGQKNSLNVTVNSGVTWSNIDKSTFIRYQKDYGAGYFSDFYQADLGSGPGQVVMFQHDASYGPAFNPNQLVYHWDALDPFSPNYGQMRPWVAAENDPSTFYETGVNSNQSVVISGGGDKTTFNLGYTRNDIKGNLPNSTLDKDLLSFSATYDPTPKLSIRGSVNYTRIVGVGRYGTGYSGLNPNQAFRQWWQTNVDIREQEEAYWRNEQNITWNWANLQGTGPIYSDNPYWTRFQNYSNDSRDNIYGMSSVNYKFTDWFSVMGRVAFNTTYDFQQERVAIGSADVSRYTRFNRDFNETNFDLLLNFNKDISENISFNGLIGSNLRRSRLSSIRASTNGGLVVPGLYSLSNTRNAVQPPAEYSDRIGVDGIFINANFGYKDLAFLELTGRRDQSTTLPHGNNSYYYPSVAANFVFSNALDLPWLSHGKVRANYAEVGNDAPALSLYNVYDTQTGFGSIPIFSLPSTRNNPNLLPERQKSIEVGVEADFFSSLFGFDFTWYKSNTINQILPVSTSAATGYTRRFVNAGEVENKGIEISAFVTPIQTNDFTWNINLNFARNRNEVVSLYGVGENEVRNIPLASFQGGVSTNAAVGEPYGVIRGYDFVYTNGQRIVNSDGYYMVGNRADAIIGNPNPDWMGGFNNTLTYKGVSLAFLIDVRKGGDVFSLDQWYGEATGLYPHTAGLNARGVPSRLPVSEGGGVLLPGVKEDGTPNDIYAENQNGDGLTPYGYAANNYEGAPRAWYVYDGSFVKLRELVLTYSLPQSVLESLGFIKSVDLQLIGRNLWIIHKNMEYSDPEEGLSAGNAGRGYQSGAYPAVRNYGFNVRFNF